MQEFKQDGRSASNRRFFLKKAMAAGVVTMGAGPMRISVLHFRVAWRIPVTNRSVTGKAFRSRVRDAHRET